MRDPVELPPEGIVELSSSGQLRGEVVHGRSCTSYTVVLYRGIIISVGAVAAEIDYR
jgi:hypothetical protein